MENGPVLEEANRPGWSTHTHRLRSPARRRAVLHWKIRCLSQRLKSVLLLLLLRRPQRKHRGRKQQRSDAPRGPTLCLHLQWMGCPGQGAGIRKGHSAMKLDGRDLWVGLGAQG